MHIKKYTTSAYTWYKDLPPWAKAVLIIGTGATAVYGVHYAIKTAKQKKEREKAQRDLINFVNDLDGLKDQGIYPSFQESQYNIWANAIVQQFSGCDTTLPQCPDWLFSLAYSASGNTVNNILKQLKNDADFLALQAAWGIKTYDECGFFTGDVENVTLSAAIASELTTCEIKGLNQTLASKNITYKF